jgi:hypothetical protein
VSLWSDSCASCAALRQRVGELEAQLAVAESKNRAAAGLLGDLGMLSARASTMVDVLLGDEGPRERPTLREIGPSDDTEPPPPLHSGDEGPDEPSLGDGVTTLGDVP